MSVPAQQNQTVARTATAKSVSPTRSGLRKSSESRRPRPLLWAILLATVPSVIAVWCGQTISDGELRKIAYTGAGTLVFGGLLGGVLKILLDEVIASKRRRDDAATFVANVLGDLKSVYDRVARAKIVIAAHRSAKTYGDEMRDLIDARVQLRNVTRALERRADGLESDARAEIVRLVSQMEDYLEELNAEFVDNYKRISDKQRYYEERAKVLVERFAKDETQTEPRDLPGFVWDSVSGLPGLRAFLSGGAAYRQYFEDPLDDASQLLRNELARILRASMAAV